MPRPKLFLLPLQDDEDDTHAVLHAAPRSIRPITPGKAALYGVICLLWLCFGIIGRDPWKPEETLMVAAIADFLQNGGGGGGASSLYGLAEKPTGYLVLAAWAAQLTAPLLPLHEGARLVNLLLLAVGFVFLWAAAARHYGVRAAWLTLLLVVGCFGFIVRAHVLNVGIAAFFGMALTLLGAAILTEEEKRRANQVFLSGLCIGCGAAFLLLTVGLLTALLALLALLLAKPRQSMVMAVAAAIFLPSLLWAVASDMVGVRVDGARFSSFAHLGEAMGDTVRVAAWSLLPLLPLAGYGVWVARREPLSRLRLFCMGAVLLGVVLFFLGGRNEEDYYLLLPPLAVLAAHALLKAPDGTASAMDFFALLIIGIGGVGGLWLVWMALTWELPPLFAMLGEALPGYVLPHTAFWKVGAAGLLTLAWVGLLSNFGRSNERAVVNWSCGVTLVWVVFNLLLVRYVDTGKSYRHVAAEVREMVGDACLAPPPERHWHAQLRYFGVPMGDESCPFYLAKEGEGAASTHFARNGHDKGYYLIRKF